MGENQGARADERQKEAYQDTAAITEEAVVLTSMGDDVFTLRQLGAELCCERDQPVLCVAVANVKRVEILFHDGVLVFAVDMIIKHVPRSRHRYRPSRIP